MAGTKTAHLGGRMLDYEHGLATPAVPGTVYIACHTGNPGSAGASNECAASNGYARKSVTNNNTVWSRAANEVSNTVDITFAAPSGGDWGIITHLSVWDASTAGNCRAICELAAPIQTYSGIPLKIPVGAYTHTEA